MELTGAEIVVRCLQEEGVEYVFGYPGGAVLFIYDELFKQNKVKHILVRHEQGAVHAADGYARSTDKVGVSLVTSGPGRHQRGDRHRHGLHGLDPARDHHRPGADARDRPGRVPGVRHGRHHAPVREAQLPGEGREGHRAHHEEGVLHRGDRPPGPGGGGHSQGRHRGTRPSSTIPTTIAMRSYNPVVKGHAGQIKKAIQTLMQAQAPDDLHRRRRRPRRRRGGARPARAPARAFPAPTR